MDYTVEFKAILPVEALVPVKQLVSIQGALIVPINQMISIPLKKVISAPVLEDFKATVTVENEIAVDFISDLSAVAKFSDTLKVKMGELIFEPDKIKIIRDCN